MDGSRESWREFQTFLAADAQTEIEAFLQPLQGQTTRVMVRVIRHGMGEHNTYAGLGSLVSEDAGLNDCGKAQAEHVGDVLRHMGVVAALDLVVVSPFTRALQTAVHMLRADLGGLPAAEEGCEARAERFGYALENRKELGCYPPTPTIVQPLCAEDTLARSHVWRGNRGSVGAELAKHPDFEVFDFSTLTTYCKEQRVFVGGAEQAENWWHHSPYPQETYGSFGRRMVRLKRWMGSLAQRKQRPPRVLLVSHGGVMEEGFGVVPRAANCGFRVFDVNPEGLALHVAAKQWVVPQAHLAVPAFRVFSVRQEQEIRRDGEYRLDLGVGGEVFAKTVFESDLREHLHDVVKDRLSVETCDKHHLRGKFPSWARLGTSDQSMYIHDYLEQLAVAMGDKSFDAELSSSVDQYLLEGRLQCQCSNGYPAGISSFLPKLMVPSLDDGWSGTCCTTSVIEESATTKKSVGCYVM